MQNSLDRVFADPTFRTHTAAMRDSAPAGAIEPLTDVFAQVQRFTSVRRREARVSLLVEAGRVDPNDWQSHRERIPEAVSAFVTAVNRLAQLARTFRPLISPTLDDVIALAAEEKHPLHTMIQEQAISLGFTEQEVRWLFRELESIQYRPVQLVCEGGFEDLAALLASISVGEGGLLLAGFARFTQDPEIDERLTRVIIRLREHGVTASVFLALVIITVAHTVAVQLSLPSS